MYFDPTGHAPVFVDVLPDGSRWIPEAGGYVHPVTGNVVSTTPVWAGGSSGGSSGGGGLGGVNFGPNEGADWLRTGSGLSFEAFWGVTPFGMAFSNQATSASMVQGIVDVAVTTPTGIQMGGTMSGGVTMMANGILAPQGSFVFTLSGEILEITDSSGRGTGIGHWDIKQTNQIGTPDRAFAFIMSDGTHTATVHFTMNSPFEIVEAVLDISLLAIEHGSNLLTAFVEAAPIATVASWVLDGAVSTAVGRAQGVMSPLEAASIIVNAERTGTALTKSDAYHRAASYVTQQQLSLGRTYIITDVYGVQLTLLQTVGNFHGNPGIFEYIIDQNGNVTHQTFIKNGTFTGTPNQVVNRGVR